MGISRIYHNLAKGDCPMYIKAPILLLSNWLFQGILYMDKTERVFKLALDMLFTLVLVFLGVNLGVSILIGHTFNWILNGHVFVVFKNLKIITTPREKFDVYLERLKKRVENEPSIVWAGVYGSLVRGEFKETSDLDIRLIRKLGVINGVRACIFVMRERSWATFHKFPLDIYVGDSVRFLENMNKKELPITLKGEFDAYLHSL
ncbi:hypothetical protein A3L09_10125 [Thermococcus profundus]|uniref:Uncharacterized protein n=1 Tax=Thermococcus profundus TaxID=49899 RepID=A0A2Z2MB17_THEPR|nr:nucleotidyltransferase domain-containing protein [Thermococcus profundus]ASJ03587.1 hypothetical protein A3L09_10125 [Thermococcus profundus]